MAPLMQLEEKDMLESSLLESVDDKPMASPAPAEEATLLDDDFGPQGVEATLKPECSASLGEIVAEPYDV